MSRASSDFRAGVEAAAKWLREQNAIDFRFGPNGFDPNEAKELARSMLAAVADDPEGTEARTVAQIVQYLREQELMADDDVASIALRCAAEEIARGDWKLK